LGFVVASLVSAYISTVSSHLNWGASYVVNDVYVRFLRHDAKANEQVLVARITTIILMAMAAVIALLLESAFQAFRLVLTIGAGTGLLFIVRWFWYRVNAWSEISAMVFSFVISIAMEVFVAHKLLPWETFLFSVLLTTIGWVSVTLLTKPESDEVLRSFTTSVRPTGDDGTKFPREIRNGIVLSILVSITIYSLLFGSGALLFGQSGQVGIWVVLATVSGFAALRVLKNSHRETAA
jgi:SSS family solute:Na+ symporter